MDLGVAASLEMEALIEVVGGFRCEFNDLTLPGPDTPGLDVEPVPQDVGHRGALELVFPEQEHPVPHQGEVVTLLLEPPRRLGVGDPEAGLDGLDVPELGVCDNNGEISSQGADLWEVGQRER